MQHRRTATGWQALLAEPKRVQQAALLVTLGACVALLALAMNLATNLAGTRLAVSDYALWRRNDAHAQPATHARSFGRTHVDAQTRTAACMCKHHVHAPA